MQLQEIGIMIRGLREERGLSQIELCAGLCKKGDLSRIELGEKIPDAFLLDSLLSRLGKSANKLEYILGEEEYFYYILRDEIEEAFCLEQMSLVRRILKQYKEKLKEKDVLHWQYTEIIEALLCWKNAESEECLQWLEKAIRRTLRLEEKEEFWELSMSRDELILLILWAEKKKTGKERQFF